MTSRAAAAVSLLCIACSAAHDSALEKHRNATPRRVGALAHPEWESSLWNVERFSRLGQPIQPLAFRSGGAATGLLLASPPAAYQLGLEPANSGRRVSVMGGPVVRVQWGDIPPLGVPSDIVGVRPDGVTWYLVPDSGRVISQDVGGARRVETTLASHGSAHTGCLVDDHTLAFLDDARPGVVVVRDLSAAANDQILPFPAGYVDGRSVHWGDLRFGGSLGGPCVLSAPGMRSVMTVSATAVRALGTFIEPVPDDPWYRRLWRWATRASAPVYAMDATSFPGGVAVLFAGHSAGAGRIVDLYTDDGAYLETIVLPQSVLRVAGNWERMYTLRQTRDSILLASYVLPSSILAKLPPRPTAAVRVPEVHAPRGQARESRLETVRVLAPTS